MSVFRSIISLLLIISIIGESSLISLSAQGEEETILHSLEELSSISMPSEDVLPISTDTDDSDFDQVLTAHREYTQKDTDPVISSLPEDSLQDIIRDQDLDTWMDTQSILIRMGIIKRRIARSLGLPGDKTITVNILEGTEIRTREPKTKTLQTVDMDTLSVEDLNIGKQQKTFHFGVNGKHLIFSKPVEVQMQVSWAQDGQIKNIRVKHAGDIGFNTSGLSIDPNTSCNPDGTATVPGSSAIVQNGKVTFYTCGASAFLIDDIGLVPTAAFGLRRLSSSYTGSAIRIRRSSDNTEQDIGFAGANLAQNRLFASDTLWDKGAGVTIAGGVVNVSGAARIINQNMGLISGKTYRVTLLANKTGVDIASRLRVTTSSTLTAEGTNTVTQAANPANGLQVVQLDIVANNPILSIAADTNVWSGTISFVSVQDISVGAVKNDLDEGAILAFAGVGSAFVRTWYDQSGNSRNASQSTQANQPRIVNAGVMDTVSNGKPGIRWFDANGSRFLETAVAPFGSANEMTIFLVHREMVRQNNVVWTLANDNQGIGRIFSHLPWSDGNIYFDVGGCCNSPQRLSGAYPYAVGTTNVVTYTNSTSSNTKSVYGNGTLMVSGPAAPGTIVQMRIGSDGSIPINGLISEFVVFNSSIATPQRKIMEQSNALYYGVSGGYIPDSPIGLIATPDNASAPLSWSTPVSNGGSAITDYKIEYKPSSGTGWTTYTDGVSTATGTTVIGLTNLVSYDFRVSAINANGTSAPSLSVSAIPQAISNMSLWLRSDMGVVASAGKVSSWIDQTGRGNTTVQNNTANQPSLTQNAINFNPSINFTAASSTRLEGTFSSRFTGTDITTLTVALPYSSSNAWAGMLTFWNSTGTNVDHNSQEGGVILHRYSSTSQLGAERQGTYYNTPANMLDSVRMFGTRFGGGITNFRVNGGVSYSGSATNGSFNADRYALGARFPSGSYGHFLNGYIAETLVFNKILSSTEYNRVESYLGIKYGISLDQSTATNYTLSDSSISWNATTAGIYKNDIAGIAKDNSFALNQIKSQSINNTGDITVEALSALGDKKSLVWANDGTATGTWINTENPPGYKRISREWKFQETLGDVGNIKVAYPASSLPAGSTGSIYLFVDIDGNFSTGSSVITGSLVGANYEFGVNIANGGFITFGYKDIVPPVISISGIGSGTILPIGSGTIVLAYSDADSGISTGTLTLTIQRYNSTLGGYDSATGGLVESGIRTQSGSVWNMNGVSFGRYKLIASISDRAGNTAISQIEFYIDAIEWSVSSDQYHIGTMTPGVQISGTGEMIITVKTIGTSFVLSMIGGNPLAQGSQTFYDWDGTLGWGYDQFISGAYDSILVSHTTSPTIANQSKVPNTNGEKTTYTYKIKFGGKPGYEDAAGLYQGNIGFSLVASY